jgi:integrase
MPSLNLTDRFVASVRTTTRENYFDAKVRGLTLRVTKAGGKSRAFVYRVNGQPSRWMALGSYPAVSLADARKRALDYRRDVDVECRNPADERRAEREAVQAPAPSVFTFAEMAAVYINFAKGKKKTWREDVQKIKKYLMPAWGRLPLRDITRTHVHELLDTLVAKGMTIGVNRVQAVISRIFTVALDRSLVEAHPAARMIKRFKENAGDRVLTDDELRALWAGLGAHSSGAADALRLRLLLGQRGNETARMTWAEVDLDARLWEMPGRRTKNGRPHAVPLATTAHAILEHRRGEVPQGEQRVFPGLTLNRDDHRALRALHDGAYGWTDLRRTVATRLASLGFDETTIGRVLNHARYTVTAKHYNKHLYLDEKRRALEAWDRGCSASCGTNPKSALMSCRSQGGDKQPF